MKIALLNLWITDVAHPRTELSLIRIGAHAGLCDHCDVEHTEFVFIILNFGIGIQV